MNPSCLSRLLAVVLIAAGLAGCDFFETWNNAPICNPRSTATCLCETAQPGRMICSDDGQGYGACTCLDGGVAGPDGPSGLGDVENSQ